MRKWFTYGCIYVCMCVLHSWVYMLTFSVVGSARNVRWCMYMRAYVCMYCRCSPPLHTGCRIGDTAVAPFLRFAVGGSPFRFPMAYGAHDTRKWRPRGFGIDAGLRHHRVHDTEGDRHSRDCEEDNGWTMRSRWMGDDHGLQDTDLDWMTCGVWRSWGG